VHQRTHCARPHDCCVCVCVCVCHALPQVDLVANVAERLDAEGQSTLCAATLTTVRAHAPNMRRLRDNPSASQQAEFADHALLMVRLLAATSTAPQFSGEAVDDVGAAGGVGGGGGGVSGPADVVMAGLEELVPMLNGESLAEPALCQK
jgi:hypothetical protein